MHTTRVLPCGIHDGQSSHRGTVLQIENNAANAELISRIIARRANLTLFTAEDGVKGLAMACSLLPDIILMDMVMPGITGYETLILLRENAKTCHIPVMILTSSTVPSQQQKCLDAGAFGYLTKPYRIDDLMALIDTALHAVNLRRNRIGLQQHREEVDRIRV